MSLLASYTFPSRHLIDLIRAPIADPLGQYDRRVAFRCFKHRQNSLLFRLSHSRSLFTLRPYRPRLLYHKHGQILSDEQKKDQMMIRSNIR